MIEEFQHEDIHYIKATVSFYKFKINVYLYFVDGLLIDTGPRHAKKSLIPIFQSLPISQVALTHHHEDHIGLGSWIESHLKKPIYIHKTGIINCQHSKSLPFYRKVFWGQSEPFQPEPIPAFIETENHKFEVIHTPGHAHDHSVLFNKEQGWLFGGDLFVVPHPKSIFSFESVPVLMESIRKVLEYDFSTLYCAHAGVVINGKKHLASKLQYLEDIQGQVMELHQNGKNVREIQKELFPKFHSMQILSGFENSPTHMVKSFLNN
ncbi:MAG: MBL fold metallo-hydrolase [Paenisporosarcina sp.]